MTTGRVRRLGNLVLGMAGLTLASGCALNATKITALPPEQGASSYSIECVRLADCWDEAKRACHGSYRVVSQNESENVIPESELPGLNSQTQGNTYRHYTTYGTSRAGGVPTYGPGIESDEPMPLAAVVVACHSGS